MRFPTILLVLTLAAASHSQAFAQGPPSRPNVLWISCEDMSPDLGCYGDKYAVSPSIDRLATQGVRYTRCFTHAGVCAPSRSGLITGCYPSSIGTHHMRCQGVPPPEVKCFPEYLRAAGWWCTNNAKTDYQFTPPFTAWNESSAKAHWRGRAKGQPFFAVFNITTTHESQVRQSAESFAKLRANFQPHELHEPAKATLPPYYPDTPVTRRDWANYHDCITAMDKQVAAILKQLDDDGLADDTIVWFWADHGRGLPRGKRWLYDSGTHVPMIIRVPEKWRKLARPENPDLMKPGAVNDELVAFVDFAPTILTLAGVPLPKHFQGRPFLGVPKVEPRQYVHGARDRMDETIDCIRMARDSRWKYLRNFMPHLSRGQDIDYMNLMPTMQEMRKLHAAGKLTGPQLQYFEPAKPVEELYDTQADPHEVVNLAGKPEHKETLERMRKELVRWMLEIGDVGLVPEPDFDALKRPNDKMKKTAAPVIIPVGQRDTLRIYPMTVGASTAYRVDDGPWFLAGDVKVEIGQVVRARSCRIGYQDSDEVVFKVDLKAEPSPPPLPPKADPHWRDQLDRPLLEKLLTLKSLDGELTAAAEGKHREALKDSNPAVRCWAVIGYQIVAGRKRSVDDARAALRPLLEDPAPSVRVAAARALADWGDAKEALPVLVKVLREDPHGSARHFAAVALDQLGEKARPALADIKAGTKDSWDYTRRVCQTIVKKLEK